MDGNGEREPWAGGQRFLFCEKDRKGASDGEGNEKKYHRASGGEHVANMEEGGREKRHIQQKEGRCGGRREAGTAGEERKKHFS